MKFKLLLDISIIFKLLNKLRISQARVRCTKFKIIMFITTFFVGYDLEQINDVSDC